MKIFYYCQHVLGIGHFHRSLALCRKLAEKNQVTLVLGGPPVDADLSGLNILDLPGLEMDSNFNQLRPCNSNLSLDEVRSRRTRLLLDGFLREQPDFFISELYPFGRKAFRFELDPLLDMIRSDSNHTCQCLSSVRDILVEKGTGLEKFEKRVVKTLNNRFDGVLIHGDPHIITLDRTFSRFHEINIPCYYTGFIVPSTGKRDDTDTETKTNTEKKTAIRHNLPGKRKRIVASIGGGGVGGELLEATAEASRILLEQVGLDLHLQLFTGPYCNEDTVARLRNYTSPQISVERFSDNFASLLQEADLSISMAGYNTSMNLVQAGIPALVLPFAQNQEQQLRAELLQQKCAITVLKMADLTPERLARIIRDQLGRPRQTSDINLNGAVTTVQILEKLYQESPR